MRPVHGSKVKVGYLVAIEGEKTILVHVSSGRKTKALSCSSFYRVNTVCYVDPESTTVTEMSDDLFLQICYSNN